MTFSMLKDFLMLNTYDDNYNKLYEIIVSDLLRRTLTNIPYDLLVETQFNAILTTHFSPYAASDETKKALTKLNIWLVKNKAKIISACFYGSTVSNCTTNQSVSIPKNKGKYIKDTVVVGPSDVDGLIVTDGDLTGFPMHMCTYRIYDSSCSVKCVVNKNLLENVSVVSLDKFKLSPILSKKLYPMYYRMLIKAGNWIYDSVGIRDLIISHNTTDEEDLLTHAYKFYNRRITALSLFINSICSNRVNNGYAYGANNCPNKLMYQKNI